MITSIAAVAAVCLGTGLVGLLAVGARWKRTRPYLTAVYALFIAFPSFWIAEYVWHLPRPHLWIALTATAICVLAIALLERDWNPPSQVFLGLLIATSASFLALGVDYAFWSGIGPLAAAGSILLVIVEAFAFLLLMMGTHDVLNVAGRVRWHRRTTGIDDLGAQPFVSIHVATHNEPPDLVLDTLMSLTRLDYENYEVIVLDNNTDDPDLWRPLEEFCREQNLRFVHLEDWPGFKSGALNHGLEIADQRTELIAVVDADFVVQPDFLKRTVGYFRDSTVGFVQTKQDFVTDDNVPYLRRLALTYRTFDEVTMPSRNEHNAIIFAGTMGLLRRRAIEDAGGRWAEWCVTEDAELSLRILGCGYSGIYVDQSFGRGVMPLTFAGLKRQRFRWCFGGIQILRTHWRLLLKGRQRRDHGADLRLTRRQRYDYLAASLQWFQSLLTLFFSVLLLLSVLSRATSFDLELRPLAGLFVAVPTLLLISGVTKSIWGLRARLKVSIGDVIAVVAIWLALSWAVALGCIQGVTGRQLPFFRTPKFKRRESFRQTITSTRTETPLALALSGAAVVTAMTEPMSAQTAFLIGLCVWGALVYWCAPVVAFAAASADLRSGTLRKRRYLESIRGRTSTYHRPLAYGVAVAAMTVLMVVFVGGSTTLGPDEDGLNELFTLPERDQNRTEGSDGNRGIAQPGPAGNGDRASAGEDPGGRATDPSVVTAGPSAGASTQGSDRGRGQGRDTAPGPGGSPDPGSTPGQNGNGPAPQASDAPGQQPEARPTPAPQGTPKPKPSPRPRPTNNGQGNGNGSEKNDQP